MVTGDRPVRRGPVAPFVLALATGAAAPRSPRAGVEDLR